MENFIRTIITDAYRQYRSVHNKTLSFRSMLEVVRLYKTGIDDEDLGDAINELNLPNTEKMCFLSGWEHATNSHIAKCSKGY